MPLVMRSDGATAWWERARDSCGSWHDDTNNREQARSHNIALSSDQATRQEDVLAQAGAGESLPLEWISAQLFSRTLRVPPPERRSSCCAEPSSGLFAPCSSGKPAMGAAMGGCLRSRHAPRAQTARRHTSTITIERSPRTATSLCNLTVQPHCATSQSSLTVQPHTAT